MSKVSKKNTKSRSKSRGREQEPKATEKREPKETEKSKESKKSRSKSRGRSRETKSKETEKTKESRSKSRNKKSKETKKSKTPEPKGKGTQKYRIKKSKLFKIVFNNENVPEWFPGDVRLFLARLRKKVYDENITILGEITIDENGGAEDQQIMLMNIRTLIVPESVPMDAKFYINVKAKNKPRMVTSSDIQGEYSDRIVQDIELSILPPRASLRLKIKPMRNSGKISSDFEPVVSCYFMQLDVGVYEFVIVSREGTENVEKIYEDALEALQKKINSKI